MTDEERKRIAAERKAAYRRRKKEEAGLSNHLPDETGLSNHLPDKSPQELAVLRLAEANGINVQPAPEAKFPPGVLYQDIREKAEVVMAESVAREEYIAFLLKPYAKSTNLPELLQGVIRELITLRVTLTDLIGGLRK